jgi:U3 small nucleolar RNA-associated protein 10
VHEYNTEFLVLTYLPYHRTEQFNALLSILPIQPPPALRFLHPYIASPTDRLPRRTIVYTAAHTPGFFNALQTYVVNVLQASHHGPTLLAFWSSITTQAIHDILQESSSGRKEIQDQKTEEMLFRVLPVLNECMKLANAPEAIIGCYMIIIVLVSKAAFEDKILDSLMEAVVLSQDSETLESSLVCLATIAEERSTIDIPASVLKRLLKIPALARTLQSLSSNCRIERLALGSAIGALEGLSSATRSGERRVVYQDIMESNVLSDASISICLSALLKSVQSCELGSVYHSQLLETVAHLNESSHMSTLLQAAAKKDGADFEFLGLVFRDSLDINNAVTIESEDEEMMDTDETHDGIPPVYPPDIKEATLLSASTSKDFEAALEAFEQVISSKQKIHQFLGATTLRRNEAGQHPLFLSFMIKLWSGPTSVAVRLAAIRSTTALVKKLGSEVNFQMLFPYLITALADQSQIVRRSAAACVTALSKVASSTETTNIVWGATDIYGKDSSKISPLSPEQTLEVLSSILVPVLEECIMDPTFIITSVRDVLQGTPALKTRQKNGPKSSLRNSLAAFLASHAAVTPLLRVRLQLLPVFSFVAKSTTSVRVNIILLTVRNWCSLSAANVKAQCVREKINVASADQIHLAALMAREVESVKLLSDLICGNVNQDRPELQDAAFDRLNNIWLSLKSESRFHLSQSLLDISLKEDGTSFDGLCRMRSLETLRNVKLDTITLTSFLESVPAALHMPEGPPAKKRRRTSRTEMARVETQSPEDTSRLLRRLTLVLELVEGSNPGEHLPLFKNLFAILGELQQLKQQSGSELVYLQSSILGSLAPIVNKLKV